jgi:ribosomal protein S18 acetylase RimI-like enzyme
VILRSPDGPVVVRAAERRDLPAIVEIYRSLGKHHAALDPTSYRVPEAEPVRDRFARVLEAQAADDAHFVAEVGGQVVGQLSLYAEAPTGDGSIRLPRRAAEIGIAVLDDWRGRGVGTALMEAAEAWARERGLDRLLLSVDTANVDAARLYERMGFRPEAIAMRKVLGAG